jgi:hypothetical protein
MDPRIVIAFVIGLVVVAFGGFYFALKPHSDGALLPQTLPPAQTATPSSAAAPIIVPPPPVAPTASMTPPAPVAPPAPPAPPPMATPASIDAEIGLSEHAELQALLKKNFNAEYNDLLAAAARRRNEGVSDQVFGQELNERFQDIMRDKLKYGAGASIAAIDKLAANEASLFHALGTEGAGFCLKMLGKDSSPAEGAPPESVQQLMRLGTLYRFQAIVEGMPDAKPVAPLSAEEMKAFEASLAREGLNFKDVSSGAYLNNTAAGPGKPCLTLEFLHLAIARLAEGTRRKIYAGMFFLGRDK